ncbi:MAG TPA: GapR family DNA-binding domain-containing protein, partial [Caulobacteraceae bacterium]|nr:GapR family DNA-binding domain-containing protein [Caulobacteraceae bacterium]
SADLKEVYAEAKGTGFDVKILRKVVRYRKQDRAKQQEEEALLDLYLSAIGER